MEASTLQHRELAVTERLRFLRPLWLQSEDGLVYLVRAGRTEAYEELVRRYHTRLLSFCRQMLKVETDAEDVLQEALTAAFYAMQADTRPLAVKPWFYRIARNRCLNHIRAQGARSLDGVGNSPEDEFAAQPADGGFSAADRVLRRQDFKQVMEDVLGLSESQRTALVLREMHGLSYEQVAETMSTSVSSVKSLLVRARCTLLEIAEARELTCEEARRALAEEVEGLNRPASAVRLHVKRCSSCSTARRRLKATNKTLSALAPIWPLASLKALLFAKGPAAGTFGSASVSGAGGSAAIGASASGGMLAIAAKTAVGLSTVAALAGGMAVVDRAERSDGGADGTILDTPVRAPAVPPLATPGTKPVATGEGPGGQVTEPPPSAPEVIPTRAAPGVIESSSPEVVPGQVQTEGLRDQPLSEVLPGTVERGRPAPDAPTQYRTRPAPPASPDQTGPDGVLAPPTAQPPPTEEGPATPAEEPPPPAEKETTTSVDEPPPATDAQSAG